MYANRTTIIPVGGGLPDKLVNLSKVYVLLFILFKSQVISQVIQSYQSRSIWIENRKNTGTVTMVIKGMSTYIPVDFRWAKGLK